MDFFVPGHEDDPAASEKMYRNLAKFADLPPAPPDQRIQSIDFTSNGESWTATVGETLSGTKVKKVTRRGERVEVNEKLHGGSAIVLAIFAGVPYKVVTDAQPLSDRPSAWANPFLAGEPSSVTNFDGSH